MFATKKSSTSVASDGASTTTTTVVETKEHGQAGTVTKKQVNTLTTELFIVAPSPKGGTCKFPDTPTNRILLKTFMLLDEDGNGMLDAKEGVAIGRMLGGDASAAQRQWEEMLREADADGSGTIELEEWMAWKAESAQHQDVHALEEHYQRLEQARARARQQQLSARGGNQAEDGLADVPPGGKKSVSKKVVIQDGQRTTTTTTLITDAQGNTQTSVKTEVEPAA